MNNKVRTNNIATKEQQVELVVAELIESADQNHTSYLEDVKEIARTYAHACLPKESDKKIEPYIEQLTGYYEKLRTDVLVRLTSGVRSLASKEALAGLAGQIKEHQDKADAHTKTLNNKKHDSERIEIKRDLQMYNFYQVVLYLFIMLESAWIGLTLSTAFNDSNVMVLIGAFVISFFLIQSVKIFTLYLRDKPFSQIPIWIKIGVPVYIVGVVVSLGLIRYTSVVISSSDTLTTYTYVNHPLIFIFITMIPLVGTALIVWRYFFSDDEQQKQRELEQLTKECNELQQSIQVSNQETERLKVEYKDRVQTSNKSKHAQEILVQRFDAYLKEAVALFKMENVKHRQDSIYPNCFNQPSPTLPAVTTVEAIINQENI